MEFVLCLVIVVWVDKLGGSVILGWSNVSILIIIPGPQQYFPNRCFSGFGCLMVKKPGHISTCLTWKLKYPSTPRFFQTMNFFQLLRKERTREWETRYLNSSLHSFFLTDQSKVPLYLRRHHHHHSPHHWDITSHPIPVKMPSVRSSQYPPCPGPPPTGPLPPLPK